MGQNACGVVLILLTNLSCAHSFRVSGGALNRLQRNGDHFVLVFGSMSTPKGQLDRPTIRFLHPDDSGKVDALLWSTTIATGQRFYAVLHPPAAAEYLDAVYLDVGSEEAGFDRILYARLRKGQEPLAMYVGEIDVRPAANRSAQGQKVVTATRDEFPNARAELRRLYPRFDGPVLKMTPARSGGAAR